MFHFDLVYGGLTVFEPHLIFQWDYFNCQLPLKIQITKLPVSDDHKMHRSASGLFGHTTVIFAYKPKSGWPVLGSVSLSSASNDFKQGWAFDVIALTANVRRCLDGIEMVHPLKVKHEPMYFANLV